MLTAGLNPCICNNKKRNFSFEKRSLTTLCAVCVPNPCKCNYVEFTTEFTPLQPVRSNPLKSLIVVKKAFNVKPSILDKHEETMAIHAETEAKLTFFRLYHNLSLTKNYQCVLANLVSAVNHDKPSALTLDEILLILPNLPGITLFPLLHKCKLSSTDTAVSSELINALLEGKRDFTEEEKTVLVITRYVVTMIIDLANLDDNLNPISTICRGITDPNSARVKLLNETLRKNKGIIEPFVEATVASTCCGKILQYFKKVMPTITMLLKIIEVNDIAKSPRLTERIIEEILTCKQMIAEGKKIDENYFNTLHLITHLVLTHSERKFFKVSQKLDQCPKNTHSSRICSQVKTEIESFTSRIIFGSLLRCLTPLIDDFVSFLSTNFKGIFKTVDCKWGHYYDKDKKKAAEKVKNKPN